MISFPNAKINLGLNIVSRRADGYHNLETIFYPIGLKDALEIVPMSEVDKIDGNLPPYRFYQTGINIKGDVENNLVIKALNLVKQDKDIPPIDIHLLKRIPFGAGLGGGSANAAQMLHLLNREFKLEYSEVQLLSMASKLGADCSFFIKNKPSFATGIGDILEEVDLDINKYSFVLVKPDVAINTAKAYSMIKPSQPKMSLKDIIKMPVEEWKHVMNNDFEVPIFKQHPIIADLKQTLYDMGAVYASMSGSGSSVFALFSDMPNISDTFKDHFVWTNNPSLFTTSTNKI